MANIDAHKVPVHHLEAPERLPVHRGHVGGTGERLRQVEKRDKEDDLVVLVDVPPLDLVRRQPARYSEVVLHGAQGVARVVPQLVVVLGRPRDHPVQGGVASEIVGVIVSRPTCHRGDGGVEHNNFGTVAREEDVHVEVVICVHLLDDFVAIIKNWHVLFLDNDVLVPVMDLSDAVEP